MIDFNKELKKYNTDQKLVNGFNRMAKQQDLEKDPFTLLMSLSDEDMFIFIAGKTYAFGRPRMDCLKNAQAHIENEMRLDIVKTFTQSDPEKVWGVI